MVKTAALLLAGLAGCSFLVPPTPPSPTNNGCTTLPPLADAGLALFSGGSTAYFIATNSGDSEGPSGTILIAVPTAITAIVFSASAIYGVVKLGQCRR